VIFCVINFNLNNPIDQFEAFIPRLLQHVELGVVDTVKSLAFDFTDFIQPKVTDTPFVHHCPAVELIFMEDEDR
tara:strand:- start:2145 stop:2366 length:222 start_codon:yes stop_codon:yes gene_type:complete